MKTKQVVILLIIISVFTNCAEDDQMLILEGVTIIDGTGNPPMLSSSIAIKDGKIIYIGEKGKFKYPDDATLLTLENRYVIPGLIEMHAHMYDAKYQEEVLKTMLAFGITTFRNPAASVVESVELRKRLVAGEIIGPRMFTAGWLIDGPG